MEAGDNTDMTNKKQSDKATRTGGLASLATATDQQSTSLEIIHAELDRRQASCEARISAMEAKAGMILAAAGVFISFAASASSVGSLAAQVCAVIAGWEAFRVLMPRSGKDISAQVLLDDFHDKPVETTQMALVRARLDVLQDELGAIGTRAKRFDRSAIWLAIAAALLIGQNAWTQGRHALTEVRQNHPVVTPNTTLPSADRPAPTNSPKMETQTQ